MSEENKKNDKEKSLSTIIKEAGKKALSGGIAGGLAMSINVLTLMWLRTTVNYQYRHGTNMRTALKTIYS
jgi:hypothetical protein